MRMSRVMPAVLLLLLAACGGPSGGPAVEGDEGAGGGEAFTGQTLIVTTLADAGPGSLRQVTQIAENGDRVRFDEALAGAIELQSTVVIERDLDIEGLQSEAVWISAADGVQPLEIASGASVHITALAFLNVQAQRVIYVQGSLVLSRVVIHGFDGGNPIFNSGSLHLIDSRITNCTGYNGGALRSNNAFTVIERSLLAYNTSGASGGAIRHHGGVVRIINSTIHGNTATPVAPNSGLGGAIYSTESPQDPNPELVLVHVTITQNTGNAWAGGVGADHDGGGTVIIRGSIIAENEADMNEDVDLEGVTVTAENNVIGIGDGVFFFHGVDGNQVGDPFTPLDPDLGPLLLHGGETRTRRPNAASPAVDAVPSADCLDLAGQPLTVDQREAPRGGAACEAGAFER